MTVRARGSVTVELALALPAVVLLLAAVLTLGSALAGQLRCADAARAGARAAALGEGAAEIAAIAGRIAGDRATVGVSTEGAWVTVTVSGSVVAGADLGGTLRTHASAVARVEP